MLIEQGIDKEHSPRIYGTLLQKLVNTKRREMYAPEDSFEMANPAGGFNGSEHRSTSAMTNRDVTPMEGLDSYGLADIGDFLNDIGWNEQLLLSVSRLLSAIWSATEYSSSSLQHFIGPGEPDLAGSFIQAERPWL